MKFKKIRDLIKLYDDNFGVSDEEIKLTEKRLGYSLPLGLVSYYKKFGNHNDLISIFTDIKSLDELEFDTKGYLVFFMDRMTGIKWGIKEKEINNLNPVVSYKELNWQSSNENLTDCINALGFQAALFKLDYFAFRFDIENSEEDKVYSNFNKLAEELTLWNSTFFQNNPNQLIGLTTTEGRTNLYIAANNEKDFIQLKSLFKDDWFSRENQLRKLKKKYKKGRS